MFHVREPVKAEVLQLCSHAKACVSVSLVEERCGTKCAQGNKSLQSKRVFFFTVGLSNRQEGRELTVCK